MLNICKFYLLNLRGCENLLFDIYRFYEINQTFPDKDFRIPNFECKILNMNPTASMQTCIDIVNNEVQASEIVYVQLSLINWYLDFKNYIFLHANAVYVFDFEIFKAAKKEKKIIVSKTWMNQEHEHYETIFYNNRDFIQDNVLLNIIFIPEMSDYRKIKTFFPAIDLPNTIFIGQTTFFKNATNIKLQWWLIETAHINIQSWVLNRQLNLLNYNVKKPLFFDCLFGKPKQHRTSFYQKMQKNKLLEYCLVTVHNWPKEYMLIKENTFSIPQKFLEVVKKDNPELKFTQDKTNASRIIVDNLPDTTCKFMLGNIYLSLSQFIDLDFYNQTAYSIVFETHFFENFITENETYFMTEKIAKPILAKRMFLVVGVANYLEKLRNLGFKTFDTVIDESYDKVTDLDQRQELIIQEMKKLVKIDQEVILQKIEPIVQHNFYHLMKLYYDDNLNFLLKQFF
jgi:hypothetical protein